MRILHVIGWLADRYGGPVTALTAFATGLAARGHTVDVVTTDADGPMLLDVPIEEPVHMNGYTVTYFHLHSPQRFLYAPGLAEFLWRRVRDYDVVHIHSLYRFPNAAAAMAARHNRVPYVMRPHGSLEPLHRHRRKVWKAAYHILVENRNIRAAAAIQFSSQKELDGSQLGNWMPRAVVVPNPVDTDLLRLQRKDGTCPPIPGGQRITYVGRLTRYKGLDLLLDAFSLLAADFPFAQLVIVGPDTDGTGPRVARRAAAMGIDNRVHLLGPIYGADRAAIIGSSTVSALLSESENFGLSAVEAMSLGVPVVVTDQVGIAPFVQDAGGGLVVQRDPAQAAIALRHYLESERVVQSDGARAADAVEREFSIGVVAASLEQVYLDVLHNPSRD